MRIKVVCRPQGVHSEIPGPNDSFPANAVAELERLGMVAPSTTYEPGYPIYGDATYHVLGIVRSQGWVESAEVVKN